MTRRRQRPMTRRRQLPPSHSERRCRLRPSAAKRARTGNTARGSVRSTLVVGALARGWPNARAGRAHEDCERRQSNTDRMIAPGVVRTKDGVGCSCGKIQTRWWARRAAARIDVQACDARFLGVQDGQPSARAVQNGRRPRECNVRGGSRGPEAAARKPRRRLELQKTREFTPTAPPTTFQIRAESAAGDFADAVRI